MADINWSGSQNRIEFCAIKEALAPGSYTEEEKRQIIADYDAHPGLISRDNNDAKIFFQKKPNLSFKQWVGYLRAFPFGPIQGACYFLAARFPKVCWTARIPLALIMIWEQRNKPEITPINERIWIRLNCKFENVDPPDEAWRAMSHKFLHRTWYYTHKTKNDKVIQWHRYSLSAKLLNIVRTSKLQMSWTAIKLEEYFQLRLATSFYFNGDNNNQIIQASRGARYQSLIRGNNGAKL